jgi:hypothetical protein
MAMELFSRQYSWRPVDGEGAMSQCDSRIARDSGIHQQLILVVASQATGLVVEQQCIEGASKELQGNDEECPVKAKTQPSVGKVIPMFFWDYKGVLHIAFLHNPKPPMRPIIVTFWRRFEQRIDQNDKVSPPETCCFFITMPGRILQT